LQSDFEAYLDIETTGLSPAYSYITVIGIYLTNERDDCFIQLVGDQITPDSILEALAGAARIYTYNGSRFDIPFIYSHFGINLALLFDHRDLMYDCWKNDLYGGFKVVEQRLCIQRKLEDINGREAVRLWWRYINDYDHQALATLLEYNKEDVLNLKVLRQRLFQLPTDTEY